TEDLIRQRLAEGRCVWCGTDLYAGSPDTMFCHAVCQTSWHEWKNDDPGRMQGPPPKDDRIPLDPPFPRRAETPPPIHQTAVPAIGHDGAGTVTPSGPNGPAYNDTTRLGRTFLDGERFSLVGDVDPPPIHSTY